METKQTLSLVQLYDLLQNPAFVTRHSRCVVENGQKMYTAKLKIEILGLGKVTLGTAYFVGQKVAFPVIFFNKEQLEYLRSHGIHFWVRKRKYYDDGDKYLCFPTKRILERIEKLSKPS